MNPVFDQIIVFAVLLATLFLFVWGRWRYDLVALAALLLVFMAGLVTSEQVFAGFGHPAVITVAAILVISRGLRNAGVVDVLSRKLARVGTGAAVQVTTLTGMVVVYSAFMNNVGALALLMPAAILLSRRSGRSPSLLLMPLAFGSLLGGLITLIGTPPNIIIALYRVQTGKPAFSMFDFAPVGLGVALSGLLLISLIGWRLVPRRDRQSAPEELFQIEEYISEVVIPENSKFAGETILDLTTAMEKETDATVVALIRKDRHVSAPSSYMVVHAGDILMVEAAPEDLKAMIDGLGLQLAECKNDCRQTLGFGEIRIMEAVITPESSLIGRTASDLHLRHRYGVNLLAIARLNQRIVRQLGKTQFVMGDILLLQGGDDALQEVLKTFTCLPLAERGLQIGQPRKIVLAVGIFTAAVALTTLNLLPVHVSFIAAALVMILAGLVPVADIYKSVDWPIIVLLGAMFPLGHALESTGGAQLIAERLLSGCLSPMGTLAMLLVGTMLLSNVINNAAAAVLMAPIAVILAERMAVSADPLLMSVSVGASCAFLTPVGHQSNALIMAPGGYRFGDYWRLGLPLSVLVTVVAVPLINYFWPLTAV